MKTYAKTFLFTGALALGANALMAAQAGSTNDWLDQLSRAKLGRSSPAAEARVKAEGANTAYREEATREVAGPANPWLEQFYRAKLGRNTPMEESRLRAVEENTAFREEISHEARPANNWFELFYKAKHGRSAPAEPAH